MLNWLHLLIQKPQLLLAHAEAYSELVAQEVAQASEIWRNRLLYGALAILLFGMAGMLCGVALMLWASLPTAQIHSPWILWLTPFIPFALALVCLQKVKNHMQRSAFFDLRQQISADVSSSTLPLPIFDISG